MEIWDTARTSLGLSALMHAAVLVLVILLGSAVLPDYDVFEVKLTDADSIKLQVLPSNGSRTEKIGAQSRVNNEAASVDPLLPELLQEKAAESRLNTTVDFSPEEVSVEVTSSEADTLVKITEPASAYEHPVDREGPASNSSGETRIVSIGGETANMELIRRIRDAIQKERSYPPAARRRGLEGKVVAAFNIDPGGMPQDIEIVESSGYSILDREVIEIVKRASPYPVLSVRIEIPLYFELLR
jgi:protein TonB